jgi:drug/metabolite transporter (DMT)-like permease
MSVYEASALVAAICWSVTSLIATAPVAYLGPVAFTRIRMAMVFAMLLAAVVATGAWRGLESPVWLPVILSGVVGIFLGDTANFVTLARLGPRRTSILFATNAPMTVALGWLILGETLGPRDLAGIATVFLGVLLAIVFGKRRSQIHVWESVRGTLWIGVAVGLFSALCQAAGSLLLRPVMAGGADPFAVAALRVGFAVACFYAALAVAPGSSRARAPMTGRVAALTAASGFLAMFVGVTFLLFALSGGQVGIVSTLSATTPALVLPMLWATTGERPAAGAFAGAALVVAGTWLIST